MRMISQGGAQRKFFMPNALEKRVTTGIRGGAVGRENGLLIMPLMLSKAGKIPIGTLSHSLFACLIYSLSRWLPVQSLEGFTIVLIVHSVDSSTRPYMFRLL